MRSLVLCLALAVPAATAVAAPLNITNPYPVNKTASLSHQQWVRMSFRNTSLRGRVLTIGENNFTVPAGKTVTLEVIVGSNVHLSSPWESTLNENLLQVTAADTFRTVSVR